jgi:tripartite-type tricarboxylate transporter receptor subunit TctC
MTQGAMMAQNSLMRLALTIAICGYFSAIPTAGGADYYGGKTIRIVVGAPVGSGPDTRARWIARHMPRYIPGQPNMIVQDMPGASGIRQANHVHNIAGADGLTLGLVTQDTIFPQLAERPGVEYDLTKWEWVGGLTRSGQIIFIRSSMRFHTLDDLRTAKKPLVFAARSVGATNYFAIRALELLGVPVKIVVGYDTKQFNIAFEQGEVDGSSLAINALARRGNWLGSDGLARLIVEIGPGTTPGVPLAADSQVPAESRALYRLISETLALPSDAIAVAPGTSGAQVVVLRQAFTAMLDDSSFLADAKKLRLDLAPIDGANMADLVRQVFDKPRPVRQRFKELLE